MIYLVLSIAVPFIVATFLAARKAPGTNFYAKVRNVFRLNASIGLHDQPLFQFGLLVPILLFFIFGFFAWADYSPSLSVDGFNEFIRISKLPLAMLSLIVPIGAIVASSHSTHQTATQIKLAEGKARAESFYHHRQELFNYFDRYGQRNYLSSFRAQFKAFPSIHQTFFNGSPQYGTPEINEGAFLMIQGLLNETAVLVQELVDGVSPETPKFKEYREACDNIHKIAFHLEILEFQNELEGREFVVDGKEFRSLGYDAQGLVGAFRYCFDFFDVLCGFCGMRAEKNPSIRTWIYSGRMPFLNQSNDNVRKAYLALYNEPVGPEYDNLS
ncbi:hypothetical protein ACF8MH_05060 [Pseudomonas sp. YQ_13]|uniref:hypothetical protein n=1 Tax=Pseudomonas sp. YQ_13 TaxID=3367235 RepID=UPI00370A0148